MPSRPGPAATICRPIRWPATRRRRRPQPNLMTAARRPTRPTARARTINVVDVPKLIGIGYFNATSKGIADAAAELGNVDAKTDGPTQGQHRRPDHPHRQLHHQRRRRHPVRRQRSGRHCAGAEEGARRRHQRRRLRRQLDAGCPPVVRQPGRVQRHRQGDGRRHGRRDRRGRLPSPSSPRPSPRRTRRAGSPRWRPMQAKCHPKHEVARDGRSAGRQHPVLQPGQHAHQQVWRRAEGHLRHDLVATPACGRRGDPGRQVRQRSPSSASPRRTR